MQKLHFTKMSGAGNDFILIDKNQNNFLPFGKKLIMSICDRRNGVGADGLISVTKSDKYDFSMRYFNADGSTGTLCGNGARCAIKFAEVNGFTKNGNVKFLSNGKKYSGEVLKRDIVKFYFHGPKDFKRDFHLKVNSFDINASYINTGSPHVVIFIEDIKIKSKRIFKRLDDVPVFDLGKKIRHSKYFQPKGTNVNFVQLKGNKLFIRTYERGVENETLACGTGAVATAIVSNFERNLEPPVVLITKGKDKLIVDFNLLNKRYKGLSLTGPAKIIFDGEISLNNIL